MALNRNRLNEGESSRYVVRSDFEEEIPRQRVVQRELPYLCTYLLSWNQPVTISPIDS